jgi:sugar lactone lactonase YvrE
MDNTGNFYIADCDNQVIRKIDVNDLVSTYAGSGIIGNTNGSLNNASFNYPSGIAFDNTGNLYVADAQNNRIRKITTGGIVSNFAGTGAKADVDGSLSTAAFNQPTNIAIDKKGNLYISEPFSNLIRKITADGIVSTYAGTKVSGATNGKASTATFNSPGGLAVDTDGNLYIADVQNNMVRVITTTGIVGTLAGSGIAGYADGTAAKASFNKPTGLGFDANGNLYVADSWNNLIRKIKIQK